MGFKMPDVEKMEKRYNNISIQRRVQEHEEEINKYDLDIIFMFMEESDEKRKCPHCGLINFAEYTRCVKCGCYISNEKIIPGSLYEEASRHENFRKMSIKTYGMLDEDLKVRKYKPAPKVNPAPISTSTTNNTSEGLTIKYRAIPSTTSTDRAENIRVMEEQNKMFREDQFYARFLDQLIWMIPVFFGSYLLNGSGLIRIALIIYFIHGCIRMAIAEERWKI